ncbi:MAG: hypothetical protein LBM01_03815 [Christensenellaceae bacterium]|jgi:hypothetical protein|nr:hypothetical protein [Christensenellaceae bacterium]
MEIKKLWEGIPTKKCAECARKDKTCDGMLVYDNLCSNVNYLEMYGEANYERNKETFAELKKKLNGEKPSIFSFGCGLGLDYLGVKEVFGDNATYCGIDKCKWAITQTENYKNFTPKLPKAIDFDDGMFSLHFPYQNPVLCFFHSLYTISKNVDLKSKLLEMLQGKPNFYIVVNFTINVHFGPVIREREFLGELVTELKRTFNIKQFDILNDTAIIIKGEKK